MKALKASLVWPLVSAPLIPNGIVILHEGRVLDVGPTEAMTSKYPEAEVEDLGNCVLMPGLVNAHAHLDLLSFQEKTGDQFFKSLVTAWQYRSQLSPLQRRQNFEEGSKQLLASGTTCVGDTGSYSGILPQLVKTPLRMVLFPEIPHGGSTQSHEAYEGLMTQIDQILALSSTRILPGLAPYAAYTLSRHLLKILSAQAHEVRIPLKMHAAETFAEMEFFYEADGEIADFLFPQIGWASDVPPALHKTPIQYLESIGFLDNSPTLIGCNHLGENDFKTLAHHRVKVVCTPRTSEQMKLGHTPIKKLREAGIAVGLGTNSTSSLNSLSLWDEMRLVLAKFPENERPTATDLLRMATLEGAITLGLEDRIGSLEAGKEGDVIAIRLPRETPSDPASLAEWLVKNVTAQEVTAVFVEGKHVTV